MPFALIMIFSPGIKAAESWV